MKMKRLFVLGLAVMFMFCAGNAFADGWADTDTSASAGAGYEAPGYFFGYGDADANIYRPLELSGSWDLGNTTISGAVSGQRVDSYAWTFSDPFSSQWDFANAGGYVSQSSIAYAEEGGNWAGGSQIGGAYYYVEDYSPIYAHVNGGACSIGGTIAIASQGQYGNTRYGAAFAATGNISGAHTNGGPFTSSDVTSFGSGNVQHRSVVDGRIGAVNYAHAGTYGEAAYNYSHTNYSDGDWCNNSNGIVGGGFAVTGGISTITIKRDSINAHASSFSMSSGGGVYTSGGVNIQSNMAQ